MTHDLLTHCLLWFQQAYVRRWYKVQTAATAAAMIAGRSRLRLLLSVVAMATRRVFSGCMIRCRDESIASLAPRHAPGPTRRYWYGVVRPKYTSTAKRGSVISRRTANTYRLDELYGHRIAEELFIASASLKCITR